MTQAIGGKDRFVILSEDGTEFSDFVEVEINDMEKFFS